MKPSERIKKLIKEKQSEIDQQSNQLEAYLTVVIGGILDYLDEEYEKNKPCEHKSAYQVESMNGDEVYYNVCNDCGILFLSKKDV